MTTAPDFGQNAYESESRRRFELLQGMDESIVIGAGVELDEDTDKTQPVSSLNEHRLSTDEPVYGRFINFCKENDLNPANIDAGARPTFTAKTHDFLASDIENFINARKATLGEKVPFAVIPRQLVSNRLDYFYDNHSLESAKADKVRRQLRIQTQRYYCNIADQYRGVFPEVHGTNLLLQSLINHENTEAAAALGELKTAYGMAISKIGKSRS